MWQNTLKSENVVDICLDLFCENEDGSYDKLTEQFSERAYTHDEILSFINNTNLELVDYYADDTFDKPNETSQRLIYVVKSTKTKE